MGIDAIYIFQDRYRSKFEPQFYEGVGFTHLAENTGLSNV
jgi:hypothetical protein